MDLKNEILNNVSLKLKGMIDGITMDMLQSALVLELNKYDISEKVTDIIPVILGHEDIRTTQVYVYVDKKDVKNTYDKYAA